MSAGAPAIVRSPEVLPALPALPEAAPLPAARNPAALYLAELQTAPGRAGMASQLKRIARDFGHVVDSMPWHMMRRPHLIALLAVWLGEGAAPATCNARLSAIRGVLRAAWMEGLLDGEDYRRARTVKNAKGSRLPAGRHVDGGELRALFGACADGTSAGARDAAAFALMFGCGLRRAEAAAAALADYDSASGRLRVIGKGNKERAVYLSGGGRSALEAWLAIRGSAPGPILAPVGKGGAVQARGMTAQALRLRLRRRAVQARIEHLTPHDLRRAFVTEALEAGADLPLVQGLAGHASPNTTVRYDRRPEAARERAARMVHVPYTAAAAG